MQQTSWNLRKFKQELRNCEAAVFMNLFIDFRHQFISQNGRSATSLFIVNISAAIFKHNAAMPYSAFTHYFVSVHLTKLPMNFNWFVVFHQQKPNHWTHLATRGIFDSSTQFKNSLWTKQKQHKTHATTAGCLLSEGMLKHETGGVSTSHRIATPKFQLLSG